MEQNNKSSKWILFALGGGCLMLFVCGAGAVALGLISNMSTSQPSYSAPQESYNIPPQENSVGETPVVGDPAGGNSVGGNPAGGNPAELVGHWRYTEIVNQDFGLVTDYNVYFYADGTFESDQVNESGQHSNYESGTWTATATTITLNVSGGESGPVGYTLNGGILMFEGISKYFEKVNP